MVTLALFLNEGRTIQERLKIHNFQAKPRSMAKSFSDLMLRGKVRDALRLLTETECNGVLSLSDVISTDPKLTVYDVLESKHPPAHPPADEALITIESDDPQVHPVIFESIDATCIRGAVLHTFGAGGPSRLDAYGWRRLCTSFGKVSNDLCHSLALVARRICSSNVHPDGLKPLFGMPPDSIGQKSWCETH